MSERRFIGVLLAAGRSARMGRTKQVMAWGNDDAEAQASSGTASKTVVEASFDVIAPHCAEIIVVVGHDAPAVVAALAPRRFEIVISDPEAEMLHSMRLGLIEAQRIGEGRGVILHLADVPGLAPEIVQMLVEKATTNPARAVMPEFRGAGGHPVVIPSKLIHPIVTWKGEGGLREFWRQRPGDVLRLPVDGMAGGAGVTQDLDEPGDVEAAQRSLQ